MKMQSVLVLAVAAVATSVMLAGCGKKVTAVPFLDRVVLVDEFINQPDLRKRVIAFCLQDVQTKFSDANCLNAMHADDMARAKSTYRASDHLKPLTGFKFGQPYSPDSVQRKGN